MILNEPCESVKMNPVVKKLLNNLKCPVCKSQIDITSQYNNYGCAIGIDHYRLKLEVDDPVVRIISETVKVYHGQHKYIIIKQYQNGDIQTKISVSKIDLEGRDIFSFKDKELIINKDYFDFTNFKLDKVINRIKTIFVFQ